MVSPDCGGGVSRVDPGVGRSGDGFVTDFVSKSRAASLCPRRHSRMSRTPRNRRMAAPANSTYESLRLVRLMRIFPLLVHRVVLIAELLLAAQEQAGAQQSAAAENHGHPARRSLRQSRRGVLVHFTVGS